MMIKSPEPTLILSDHVTLKTPSNNNSNLLKNVTLTSTAKHKSHGKKLIIYETTNAYDNLR